MQRITVDVADNVTADVSTTSAASSVPTAASDGIETPNNPDSKIQILVEVTRSAGTVATHIELYGYNTVRDNWYLLEDLTDGARTDAASVNLAYQIEAGRAFSRYATRQATTLGGTGTVATWMAFS